MNDYMEIYRKLREEKRQAHIQALRALLAARQALVNAERRVVETRKARNAYC